MSPSAKKLRADQLKAFDLAAAGHDGVLSDESGTLVIKPCTAREVSFYETANTQNPAFAQWMPLFFGTLQLNDPSSPPDTPATHNRHTSIVLQNLTSGFNKPCVLDVKLGAQLWDEEASQDKRDRLDKVSNETTSRSLGFRVAGMKVWKGEQEGGYKVFDKWYGRTFNAETVVEAIKEYFGAPIEDGERKLLVERFGEMVGEVRKVLEGQESRMYSASLLFVYEGDGKAIKEALEEEKNRKLKIEDEEEEEDEDEEENVKKVDELKLIDFAHASWTPGQGPDENALQGVRSIEKLLKELYPSA